MSKHSIDDIIKKAMEEIESKPKEADWDSFKSLLNSNELTEFDQYVKSHLEKVSVPPEGKWNTFEDKYAEELGNPHPVDELVKDHLDGHKATFVENSWSRMSALLDLTDHRERDLFIKKLVEVLSVGLILFLFLPHFLKDGQDQQPPAKQFYAEQNPQSEHTTDLYKKGGHKNAIPSSSIPPSSKDQAQISSVQIDDAASSNHHHQTQQRSSDVPLDLSIQNTTSSQVTEQISGQNLNTIASLPSRSWNEMRIIRNSATPFHSFQTTAQSPFPLHQKLKQHITAKDQSAENMRVDILSSLPLPLLGDKPGAPYTQIELAEMKREKDIRISVFTAPQLTHIYTPEDNVYTDPKLNIEPYGRVRVFNAMGMEVEKHHADLSLGGSVNYSELNYTPPIIVEKYAGSISVVESDNIRDGYKELSLVNLQLQMISASMFIRKYYPLGGNMKMFAHLGSGINMVMKSDYLVQEITKKGNGTKVIREIAFENGEESAATKHVKLRQKNFEEGILEGGNFNRNSYMDIELGTGIEYEINKDCSVYLASIFNYSPFSDGLGPNRDKINNLSFQFGVKQLL